MGQRRIIRPAGPATVRPKLLHVRNSRPPGRRSWAAYVRAARQAVGLSQSEVARRMGVNRSTIGRWEAGRFGPDRAADAVAFAQAVQVDPEDALAAAGFRPTVPPPAPPEEVPIDDDLRLLLRKLADPRVNQETKHFIRAQLRYLADIADQLPEPRTDRRAS